MQLIKELLAKDHIAGLVVRRLLILGIGLIIFFSTVHFVIIHFRLVSYDEAIFLFGILRIFGYALLIFYAGYLVLKEEKKIRHNEKLSRMLIENRKDYAIFLLDSDGKIKSWNRSAERLMGYEADEVIGKPVSVLFSKEEHDGDVSRNLLKKIAELKQLEYEGWRVHKNGTRFWATVTSSALYDDKNQLIGFTKLVRNSTRQKEADDKLKELVESLEHSNQELDHFAHIVSHDLQEPLRMVASFMKLLVEKYQNTLDQEAKNYIEFALDGTTRMQKLITDLLAYSRVTTQAASFVPTNCQMIVAYAIQNLNVMATEKKAKIIYNNLPTVMGDETQLLQLFQNLLSNALKFQETDNIPEIHITAKRNKQEWIFEISDNGIGISPESHHKIFLIFQRLHSRKEFPGSGLGLAICEKIITRHKGRIWLESEMGKGTRFFFTIPA